MRSTWHTNIYKHTYGRNVRARITLRKQLGREAKATEVEEALQDKDNKFKTISVDDIARAYDSGDEVRNYLPFWLRPDFLCFPLGDCSLVHEVCRL